MLFGSTLQIYSLPNINLMLRQQKIYSVLLAVRTCNKISYRLSWGRIHLSAFPRRVRNIRNSIEGTIIQHSELKNRGYITSLSQKAYRAMLTLTAAGQEVARKFDHLIEGWVSTGGDGLTDEERTDFYRSLSSITENLRSRIETEAKHLI